MKEHFRLSEIEVMSERSKLFFAIRKELKRRGYWKSKPRGKPDAKYFRKLEQR